MWMAKTKNNVVTFGLSCRWDRLAERAELCATFAADVNVKNRVSLVERGEIAKSDALLRKRIGLRRAADELIPVRRTCGPSQSQIDGLQIRRTRAANIFSFQHAFHRLQSREDIAGFAHSSGGLAQPALGVVHRKVSASNATRSSTQRVKLRLGCRCYCSMLNRTGTSTR